MRRVSLFVFVAITVAGLAAGCGGGYNAPAQSPSPQTSVVSVSMTDAPPAGVTVLSFEVSLTGATLTPGNVDLLGAKGPIRVEVKQLETETGFLSTNAIPAGNYTGLSLTFANPELTFMNGTGATLAGCAAGAVCEIKPSGTLASTVTGTFNVTAGSQSGILIDVNLATLISNSLGVDFSAAGAVSATQQVKQGQGELEDLDEVEGIVKTPASNQFTLQTTDLGNITVSVDNNTQFRDFESCAAANSSCLQDGQSVEADLLLMAGGGFLAKKVELRATEAENQNGDNDDLEGVVFKVDSATQFEIVVIDELRDITNVSVGNPVTVQLQTTGSGTSFEIDANGLSVPAALQTAFQGASDTSQLMPGQTVDVRKRGMTGGPAPAPIVITTDRVRLRDTRFTATVSGAPAAPNFNVGNLPAIFTANGVTTIQVQTSSQTNFDGGSSFGSLADGAVVSLRGLLFKSTANPVLLADKVRKR